MLNRYSVKFFGLSDWKLFWPKHHDERFKLLKCYSSLLWWISDLCFRPSSCQSHCWTVQHSLWTPAASTCRTLLAVQPAHWKMSQPDSTVMLICVNLSAIKQQNIWRTNMFHLGIKINKPTCWSVNWSIIIVCCFLLL